MGRRCVKASPHRSVGWMRCASSERLNDQAEIVAARAAMAGWYGTTPTAALCACLSEMQIAAGAKQGLRTLREAGVRLAIVSITRSFAVEWSAERFGADSALGTELGGDGAITHVWPADKPMWLGRLADRIVVSMDEVPAVGDSTRDVPFSKALDSRSTSGRRCLRSLRVPTTGRTEISPAGRRRLS